MRLICLTFICVKMPGEKPVVIISMCRYTQYTHLTIVAMSIDHAINQNMFTLLKGCKKKE